MLGTQQSGHIDDQAVAEWRRTRALRQMGPGHSREDCHEFVLRLKAQAQCLEEILSDIRSQIDELECEETLEQVKETLEAEI